MPAPTPHRTPLRRVSQGSLLALSRSSAHHQDAPHGLGFLEPALAELADEAEALRGNVEGLRALSASLDTFNEAFSSWLYVMNMNALTVDWPEVRVFFFVLWGLFVYYLLFAAQAPTEASFIFAQRRAGAFSPVPLNFAFPPPHEMANEQRKTRARPRQRLIPKRSRRLSWMTQRMRPLWVVTRRLRTSLSPQSPLPNLRLGK